MDNRPLNFEEFESKVNQMLFVSATPGEYEERNELLRAEQVIRPTGLLDPEVEVRPVEGQIDDLVGEVNKEIAKKNKVLITTLTKRMAEDLTDYMRELGIRVKYLHSDIDTLERTEIIRDMRMDVFDVLVGINLLRRVGYSGDHTCCDSRCRQGRIPSFGDIADPDDRSSCKECRGSCDYVRGYDDRFYEGCH